MHKLDLTRRNLLQTAAVLLASPQTSRAAANDRIAVGFIGVGARGQELIQAVQKHPNVEIAGLCDAYTGRIARALDRTAHRPKVFPTHREMVAEKSIDAVIVATPDHLNRSIVLDALNAGKDVYCERPLTYRSSEGLEIIKAARDHNRIVQVGSQGISSDLQQKARIITKGGWLGTMTTIRAKCNRNTVNGAGIYPVPPDASPKTVNWEMFLGDAPKRPYSPERFFRWRSYEDYSGGLAADFFVDLCTSIHYLWDVPAPTRVMAMGQKYRWGLYRDLPDTLNAILEYPRGFVVVLSATLNSEDESSIEFLGTEGRVRLDADTLRYEPEEPLEDNRRIVETWPQALEDKYYKDTLVIKTEIEPAKLRKGKEEEEERERKDVKEGEVKVTDSERPHRFRQKGDPTVDHLGHFFDSVRTRKPFWEDATAGHRAAACAHMINRSAKEMRVVEWDPQKDDIRS
jgi:predicted dehydrogenase